MGLCKEVLFPHLRLPSAIIGDIINLSPPLKALSDSLGILPSGAVEVYLKGDIFKYFDIVEW